ncbi:MAG: hypothetical protein QXT25_02155 [Candidatus Anstonellaceae archaeon]
MAGFSKKTVIVYPQHSEKRPEKYSAEHEIVFSRVETGHYPKAGLALSTDQKGALFIEFESRAGEVYPRVLKNDGLLTSESQWLKRYYFIPENFENGASIWLLIGWIENMSIDDVVRHIKEEGKFTVEWEDYQNRYEYTAYSIFSNKLTGELKMVSNYDTRGSTRIMR